jgi:diguanylate cyclase (GGDEF)-like protein
MVLVNVGDDRAVVIAERIRSAFEQLVIVVDSQPIESTVSIGVSLCKTPRFDITALLSQADQALYRAKHFGRNRIERAIPDDDSLPYSDAPSLTPATRKAAVTAA